MGRNGQHDRTSPIGSLLKRMDFSPKQTMARLYRGSIMTANQYRWPDGTRKSKGNAFDWRTGGTQFAVKMQRSRVTAQHASANVAAGKASTISLIKGRKS
jgi:hypothetical protein